MKDNTQPFGIVLCPIYNNMLAHEARMVFLAMCLFVFVLCVHWYFFIERFCDFFESNRSLAHSAIYLTNIRDSNRVKIAILHFGTVLSYMCALLLYFFFITYLFINWILFRWLHCEVYSVHTIAQTARNELVYC